MRDLRYHWVRGVAAAFGAVVLAGIWTLGCAGGSASPLGIFGAPFPNTGANGVPTTPGNTGNIPGGGGFGGNDRTNVDPCSETQSRKFIRISLRNGNPDDFVHYFLVLVAFVSSDMYPAGAVCPDDIELYTSFGYIEVAEGAQTEFGTYCIRGPALYYFHRAGQFRQTGGVGGSAFASAIPPAQGQQPTYDSFFSSAAPQVPVPNQILFYNPGTGEGAALKISRNGTAPCAVQFIGADDCTQDAFYYVDEADLLAGSTALGVGSGRRVPSEIQGTGCQCIGVDDAFAALAPSRVTANSARCNEFLRGGRVEYVFLREDTNPPFPQAVWRVSDASGALVHDFDERANLP